MTLRDRQLEGLTAHLTRYALGRTKGRRSQRTPEFMVEFFRTRSEGARGAIMESAGVPADDTLWAQALTRVEQEVA